MQLVTFLATATEQLKVSGIDNPSLDVRWLACHVLGLDRAALLSQSQRVLTEPEIAALDAVIDRRVHHEPVARIIGQREFWGLPFGLNEATLEPRPDSETLVEAVLSSFRRKPESSGEHLRARSPMSHRHAAMDSGFRRNDEVSILDLGTGTGCLLLSLLHELPDATGIGIDLNPRAVEQATQNAAALGLGNRAVFCTGNWFDALLSPPSRGESQEGGNAAIPRFDIIVSNPPYIRADDLATLMPEVRDYDPALALDGGEDGLAPYRLLIPQLKNFLNTQGLVAFEVGQGQAQQVAALFRQHGFNKIETHKDLGGIERCVLAEAPHPLPPAHEGRGSL